jgi:hypothetical protein
LFLSIFHTRFICTYKSKHHLYFGDDVANSMVTSSARSTTNRAALEGVARDGGEAVGEGRAPIWSEPTMTTALGMVNLLEVSLL